MWLFCGLGNPGEKYRYTRHNFGFLVVEAFAKKHRLNFKFYKEMESEATFYKDKAIIIKPLTFMNLSGKAVKKWVEKEKIPLESLLVIYDDMDLPLGKIKILPKGGSGGHRGMISVIETLGSSDFPRMRLGIGKPINQSVTDYVLSLFSEEEIEIVHKIIDIASSALDDVLYIGLLKTMTKYNSLKINDEIFKKQPYIR
ncbi:aminoacyl-tRNA hydrolase [Thermodesulfobacterium hydrogeniphilum]|uniref:aminoacyl-tRNA hydrolase n=1 Tax=Thermodesulfobacterium hydrogeniphilum TaxID=161156 RepID=UPI00056EB5D7|nr:aminoacyl-tRNA hydrolase [Thermodesulfobacterium hydrogeniphilum]